MVWGGVITCKLDSLCMRSLRISVYIIRKLPTSAFGTKCRLQPRFLERDMKLGPRVNQSVLSGEEGYRNGPKQDIIAEETSASLKSNSGVKMGIHTLLS